MESQLGVIARSFLGLWYESPSSYSNFIAEYGWMGGLDTYFYERLLFGQEHAISWLLGLATYGGRSIDFVCRDAK
jgi:hypothetical protein